MYKIRKVKFIDHPILKNLGLDFCNQEGQAVDTVILAGENGSGKSNIISALYEVASHEVSHPMRIELEEDGRIFSIYYHYGRREDWKSHIMLDDERGNEIYARSDSVKKRYHFSAIYSDVDINFHASDVPSVTSLTLDSVKESRRSGERLPTQINQLLVDIQAIDDAAAAYAAKLAKTQTPGLAVAELRYPERMPRFTSAFNRMFDELTYSRVENQNNKKSILFQKRGVDIPIGSLSTGEKQVVYRGCFLLKDANAMNGAFVFIDEPEISLHPTWQMKIMDYYKGIFTNEQGKQTSQIFTVTHSPFVIHNDNRRNDKVIVLARDENGDIVVKDKPEYYKCHSLEAVEDAFSVYSFSSDKPTVYLEGRTDELYFNKAVEAFNLKVPFRFKWIGHIDSYGQEVNTGKAALDKAVLFLKGNPLSFKNIFLYDCDVNKVQKIANNIVVSSMPKFSNTKNITVGIENALEFGNFDIEPYKRYRVEPSGYGMDKQIPEFLKMQCCEDICKLSVEQLRTILANLKEVINSLVKIYNEA